ncbi:MAG TPA: hypothetical protein VED47_06385, partial [Burkholderiaceae bacterium]|nr:hypothetical protein [Burkholderiaceae bacterium]
DVVRPFMVSSITARLDRLERNIATLLELVRALPSAEASKTAAAKRAGTIKSPNPPGWGSGTRR